MVNGMGLPEKVHLRLLDIYLGVRAFVVILAMIVMEVGVDDNIYVLGFQIHRGKGVLEFQYLEAVGFSQVLGNHKLLQARVHQDIPIASLYIKDINRNPYPLSVIPEICHDTLVRLVRAHNQWMNRIFLQYSTSSLPSRL